MYGGQQLGTILAPDWKQWEGHVVDGVFPLHKYVTGGRSNAVFLTEYEAQKAAIKLFAAPSQDADLYLSRWQLASGLSHPHLIRLFSFGRGRVGETALVYVVMEWAEENLAEVLPQRPLTPPEVRDLLEPALSVLAYIHREGVVHGHLKPSNLLAVDDNLKVSADSLRRISEVGAGQGISPASDVYSLGSIIAEALTQRPPDPMLVGTLPEPFRDIVHHCLQSKPESRWTILQIEECLKQPLRAPQPWWRAASWRTGVGLAALGLAVLSYVVIHRERNRLPETTSAPATQPASKIDPTVGQVNPPQPATSGVAREVLSEVLPDVPQAAQNTIRGSVRVSVRVKIDPMGNVTEAKFDSKGPSPYFADLALRAARRWKFQPMRTVEDGIVRFEFLKDDTKASFKRVSPDAR